MSAHSVDLTIYKGVTFVRRFLWKSGPKGEALPVDMTGCSALLQARMTAGVLSHATDHAPVVTLSTADDSISLGVDGSISFLLSAEQTQQIEAPSGTCARYDLLITFPGGRVVRRLAGDLHIKQGATRAE